MEKYGGWGKSVSYGVMCCEQTYIKSKQKTKGIETIDNQTQKNRKCTLGGQGKEARNKVRSKKARYTKEAKTDGIAKWKTGKKIHHKFLPL